MLGVSGGKWYRFPAANFKSFAQRGDGGQVVLEVAQGVSQLTISFAVIWIELEQAAAGADENFNVVHVTRHLGHHVPATFVVGK